MDSKLVVEQMSGRWKIKHPDMKPLAAEADRLAPSGTTYTWIPREQNKHADRLANEALDGKRDGVTVRGLDDRTRRPVADRGDRGPARRSPAATPAPAGRRDRRRRPPWSWSGTASPPHTVDEAVLRRPRRAPTPGSATRAATRSGRPPSWLAPLPSGSTPWSPRRYAARRSRPRSSPRCSASRVEEEPGFAEMEFGVWDGLTFAEVAERDRDGPRRLARRRSTSRPRAASRSATVEDAGARRRCDRLLDDARRADRGGRQPRHPDQDPGRARARRAARSRSSGWSCRRRRSRCVSFYAGGPTSGAERGPRCGCYNALAARATTRFGRRRAGTLVATAQISLTMTSSWVPVWPARRPRRSSRGRAARRRAGPASAGWRRPRAARARSGPWSPC